MRTQLLLRPCPLITIPRPLLAVPDEETLTPLNENVIYEVRYRDCALASLQKHRKAERACFFRGHSRPRLVGASLGLVSTVSKVNGSLGSSLTVGSGMGSLLKTSSFFSQGRWNRSGCSGLAGPFLDNNHINYFILLM